MSNTFYETIEQCRCPNEACDSVIPNECVAANTDPSSGVRTVRAYCRHCKRLWLARFELRGGLWGLKESPHAITDTRTIESFKHRIAHVLGEVQGNKFNPVRAAV